MKQERIDRINDLYRKSKAEGLTPEEKKEQEALRMEFRMAMVGDLANTLKNVKIRILMALLLMSSKSEKND